MFLRCASVSHEMPSMTGFDLEVSGYFDKPCGAS
jgi:hypothetical protein